MSVDMSNAVVPIEVFGLLENYSLTDTFVYKTRYHVDSSDNNSEIYKNYEMFKNKEEGGQRVYTLAEFVTMMANNDDMDVNYMAKEIFAFESYNSMTDILGYSIDGNYENACRNVTLLQLLWQWRDHYAYLLNGEEADKKEFATNLLTNTKDAYFYEGTGQEVIHLSAVTDSGSACESGVFNKNGQDYIFAIYTKNATNNARKDLVSEISRILYESI
jgi:hypothetical protein